MRNVEEIQAKLSEAVAEYNIKLTKYEAFPESIIKTNPTYYIVATEQLGTLKGEIEALKWVLESVECK